MGLDASSGLGVETAGGAGTAPPTGTAGGATGAVPATAAAIPDAAAARQKERGDAGFVQPALAAARAKGRATSLWAWECRWPAVRPT